MKKKYVIHPGYVTSKNYGDEHFIDAPTIMRLYKVPPGECDILTKQEAVSYNDKQSRYYNYEPELIHLFPDYHGDYEITKGRK